jgi:hypothetical protein
LILPSSDAWSMLKRKGRPIRENRWKPIWKIIRANKFRYKK